MKDSFQREGWEPRPRRSATLGHGAGEAQLMRRSRRPIEDLRTAIDCLPARTREAMLEGVRSNAIIVGAYTDRSGGVCPMLAAHRCGARTALLSLPRAGDGLTGARGRPR